MSEDYLEAARTIRSYLPDLLDSEEAQSVDAELSALLNQSDQDVDDQIFEVLISKEETRRWTVEFLGDNTSSLIRNFGDNRIPGNSSQPISGMIKYVCPHGYFSYYQRQEGEEIPLCPTHNCALIRDSE